MRSALAAFFISASLITCAPGAGVQQDAGVGQQDVQIWYDAAPQVDAANPCATITACGPAEGCCPEGCDVTNDGDCPLDCRDPSTWPAAWAAWELELLTRVNQVRASGYTCASGTFGPTGALTMNSQIQEAARCHTVDQADHLFMGHGGTNGSTLGQRITATGYRWGHIAENVGRGQDSPADAMNSWLTSLTGHCGNIMDPDNRHFGAGHVYTDADNFNHYWTQNFAKEL